MSIEQMRGINFRDASYEEWQAEAEKALKGKPFDMLLTNTLEGITLQPLYTKEMVQNYRERTAAAVRQTKSGRAWVIAQDVFAYNAESYLTSLKESLAKGNEAIVYKGEGFIWSEELLDEFSALITQYPIHFYLFDPNDPIYSAFQRVNDKDKVKGYVSDVNLLSTFPNLKLIVDTTGVHYKGSNAVQELAAALYMASEQAGNLDRMAVRFQVDTNFFMEIAKLRAFRILWKALTEAYGVTVQSVDVIAETSLRSFSKLDTEVNLLRSGNMAFSAALGGADLITVHPHTILAGATELSIRSARNVQLILKEEAHIGKVADPAGGSYYVESLTAQLVELAWNRFLQLQDTGLPGLDSEIEAIHLKREELTAKRIYSLIGTNKYSNPTDVVSSTTTIPVPRYAEPFEKLRQNPSIVKSALLLFGPLKDHKPRADFVNGFLHVGGLTPTWSPGFTHPEEAAKWLMEQEIDYAVVCAKDDMLTEVVEQLLQSKPTAVLDVAGRPDPSLLDKWKKAGLNGTIYNGQNVVEKLTSILSLQKGAV